MLNERKKYIMQDRKIAKEMQKMNLIHPEFKREFSASMYKNLRIKLGEMRFFADFVNDTQGCLMR